MKTQRILNCIPSRKQEDDWLIDAAFDVLGTPKKKKLPLNVDHRISWWKIGNQGNTGSCVGWASADSVIRWHFVVNNRINKNDLLSVRFLWMGAKETDQFTNAPTTFLEAEGTSLKAALDIARNYGNVFDKDLPFVSGALYQGNPQTFFSKAAQYRINSYYNLGTNPERWREWLALNGPILTRLDCDNAWFNIPSNGKLDTYVRPSQPAGHAVALVGYTPEGFIVRNSWGTGWGHNGFAYASNKYAAAAFTEAYGVLV